MEYDGAGSQELDDEEARAMHLARCERVRNVLDNRGLIYDEQTVWRLADEGEEALMEYLVLEGVTPHDPLMSRADGAMDTGRLVD